jgi:2-haloacid dehalogenase
MAIRAVLFDVYGTLLDVHGVAVESEALFPGYGSALSELWRTRQIDYTRLRTLSGRHADFAQVTADALDYAAARLGLPLTPARRQRLLAAYEVLPAFADVLPALTTLSSLGLPLGVLSNGTPAMLEGALGAADLAAMFARTLSVEPVGKFKTAPEAYALGTAAFEAVPGEIVFVSSNGWDVAGAGWFGYRTFWVNRNGDPMERLGIEAAGTGRSLGDLVGFVSAELAHA